MRRSGLLMLMCCGMILAWVRMSSAQPFQPVAAPLAALHCADARQRLNVATVLGMQRDVRAVEPLIDALRDPDAVVRSNAAWALGAIGDRKAVMPLIAALKDLDSAVRTNAISSLRNFRDDRIDKTMIDALHDVDAGVRANAASSFLGKRNPHAMEALVKALADKSPEVRFYSAWAVSQYRDARVDKALMAALGRADVAVVGGAHTFYIARGISESEPLLIQLWTFVMLLCWPATTLLQAIQGLRKLQGIGRSLLGRLVIQSFRARMPQHGVQSLEQHTRSKNSAKDKLQTYRERRPSSPASSSKF